MRRSVERAKEGLYSPLHRIVGELRGFLLAVFCIPPSVRAAALNKNTNT
jgi:hypothetical protein